MSGLRPYFSVVPNIFYEDIRATPLLNYFPTFFVVESLIGLLQQLNYSKESAIP